MANGQATAVASGTERPSTPDGPADDRLVALVRRGDDRAFEQLYERYRARIAAYVYGMTRDYTRAEDITQDVFVSALRRMRATERPIAFKPWIYEIARNACIDAFRRTRRAELVPLDADEGAPPEVARLAAPGPTTEGAVMAKEQLENLQGALDELSDTHHEVLVLRELEGLSYREIGERLGMTKPSVESTAFRARRRLHEEYGALESGARCERTRELIDAARGRRVGARDMRRLGAHTAHCGACRRDAVAAGLDPAMLDRRPRRRRLADKLAGLLPLPWFWRRDARGGGGSDGIGMAVAQAAATPGADHAFSAWAKAVVAVMAVLVAGTGAGVAVRERAAAPDPTREAKAVERQGASSPARAGVAPAAAPLAGAVRARERASTRKDRRAAARDRRERTGRERGARRAGARPGSRGDQAGTTAGGAGDSGASGPVTPDAGAVVRETGGAVERTTGAAGGTVERTAGTVGGAVEQTTGAAGGTVERTAGTVGGAVEQTTGAAGGTVERTAGTVGGAVEAVEPAPTIPAPVAPDAVDEVEATADGVTGGVLP